MSRDLGSVIDSGFDSDADSLLGRGMGCWKEVATTTTVVVEGLDHRKGRMDS